MLPVTRVEIGVVLGVVEYDVHGDGTSADGSNGPVRPPFAAIPTVMQ